MYIRHIDHRSGAPWGPHGREGGKKYSRQSRENFFREKEYWSIGVLTAVAKGLHGRVPDSTQNAGQGYQ